MAFGKMVGFGGSMIRTILEVNNLCKSYDTIHGSVDVLQNVSFRLREGMTLGILGESGSGKSTLGRCLLRLIEPDQGQIRFDGEDISYLPQSELRHYRQRMQMIFQNPLATLDPRMSILENMIEPLWVWQGHDLVSHEERAVESLRKVRLDPEIRRRFPMQLSGGQLQRVHIARALMMDVSLLVCDEAVSSLDVSVQAQILDLLLDIQDQKKISYVFISHDLSVVEAMSEEVLVLHKGRVVEFSSSEEVFRFPKEPYTQKLVSSLLKVPKEEELKQRISAFYPSLAQT